MVTYCAGCKKTHEDFNWQTISVESPEITWICSKWFKPSRPEFVPQRIKDQRNEYAKSLLQPYRGGTASQEYIDAYGTGRIQPEDIKKAKPVWKDVLPSNWKHSK